jgi:cyclopropane-fatty-acyl-phospholipid synthase
MADARARLLITLARRAAAARAGTLRFEGAGTPGGRPIVTGSGAPMATADVHDPRAWRAVLARGSRGLAESYVDRWWDTDDLTALLRVAFRRTTPLRERLDAWARTAGPLLAGLKWLRTPSKSDDRRNIASHYDLSNDLFALMLDPTMAYSCAYFTEADTTLEEAQVAKFERIACKLGLGPEDHVVEIGTGWGGFAIHAAERHGCRVTTTTISEAQRSFAEKRVAEHGLADRVTVLGADYRDLEGRYDALVCIEMIEAVDWRRYDRFFATCARLLTDRGRMALQAITIADGSFERAKLHDDFIRAMVFPGGCLPSIAAIAASVARTSDLRIVDLEDIGPHYAETLRRWRHNLEHRRAEVERLGFDDRFWRLWTLYLSYCEAAFMERHISDVQLFLARPHATARPGLPWPADIVVNGNGGPGPR